MAVAVAGGASFEAGPPVFLFQTHRRQTISAQDVFSYDISPDGQKFLIATKTDEANAAPLSVLLNLGLRNGEVVRPGQPVEVSLVPTCPSNDEEIFCQLQPGRTYFEI